MNILVISSKYPPEYAGSGFRAHNTYKRLKRKYGISFDVIASSLTDNRSRTYTHDDVSVKVIANKMARHLDRTAKNLWQRISKGILYRLYWQINYWREAVPMIWHLLRKGHQYDLLHVFGNVTITSVAITYAKITKKPLIVELVNLVDDPHQYEPTIFSWLYGKGFPKHALIVCLSEYLKDACEKHGYPEHQLWSRPNPVDETRFNMHPQDDPQVPFAKSPTDTLILHLAKFMPRKNQVFMVDVLSHLPSNFKLVLAGPIVQSGPHYARDKAYLESIEKAISHYQLEDRVYLLPGFVNNPESFIKATDIFVLPAEDEAFGTPFLEAMACGVPVVVHHIPGVFDQWVTPDKNGFLCPLNAEEWAEKLQMTKHIVPENLKQISDEVLKTASTEVIDREYYQRMTDLLKPPTHN